MASIIEDRVLKYLQENATDGRILIKLDDLTAALGETRNPIYRALTALVKKRKIKSENRSRMGLEITLLNKASISTQNETSGLETQYYDSTDPETLPFEELLSRVRLLNINQLHILSDFVELNIMKKTRSDNND